MDISAGQGVKRKVSKFADQYALIFEADENFVTWRIYRRRSWRQNCQALCGRHNRMP